MLGRPAIYTIPDGRIRKREERAALVIRVVDAPNQIVDLFVFGVVMLDMNGEADREKPAPNVDEAGAFQTIVRNVAFNSRGLPGTWRYAALT